MFAEAPARHASLRRPGTVLAEFFKGEEEPERLPAQVRPRELGNPLLRVPDVVGEGPQRVVAERRGNLLELGVDAVCAEIFAKAAVERLENALRSRWSPPVVQMR